MQRLQGGFQGRTTKMSELQALELNLLFRQGKGLDKVTLFAEN